MMQGDFLEIIRRFVLRPTVSTEGRHVYLWLGESRRLDTAIPAETSTRLDLHGLAARAEHAPGAPDEAQRLLRGLIERSLGELVKGGRQQIVLVTGCDLLSRYRVPLTSFYEIASENTMVIFTVPRGEAEFRPNTVLPDYITLEPAATIAYLRSILGENTLVEESEAHA